MPTRRQNPENSAFRQDAFASSAEFERGILGNLVAARCHKLTDRGTIALLWWLQQVSWREGGLEKFATDFLAGHQHLIGTRSMHKFGMEAKRVYTTDEVKAVRIELSSKHWIGRTRYPLKGERAIDLARMYHARRLEADNWAMDPAESAALKAESQSFPTTYPAAAFLKHCAIEPEELVKELKEILLNPETMPSAGLWNLPGLWDALQACRDREIQEDRKKIVHTDITRKIHEELDFALQTRAFVLIEGREGIGKSEGAKNWCDCHPGEAIYVRVEAGADETSLYRSIARKVGTACSYARRTIEMKVRLEDALQHAHVMLVLDEAHFLWPQFGRSQRVAPKRVDWIRTALVDFNVPIALISTPQYFSQQCQRFRHVGWNATQIERRLTHTLTLPDQLDREDVLRIARLHFPAVDEATLKKIGALALGTVGYLATITHFRKRVDFLASREPKRSEKAAIDEALREFGLTQAAGVPNTAQASLKAPLRSPAGVPLSSEHSRVDTQVPRVVQSELAV